ncbi:MAG: hypothetical protein JOZ17_18655 [Acetobacteraceae bacterium]|nr:hypothetical protein [Acetobacteraceae bacterium]
MDLLIQVVGAAIAIVALLDVFFTILFPASGHGPVRNLLGWAVWRSFRRIGTTMTGQRRRSFLSYSGPILFTVTFTAWFMLLVVGWAVCPRICMAFGVWSRRRCMAPILMLPTLDAALIQDTDTRVLERHVRPDNVLMATLTAFEPDTGSAN